MKGVDLSSELDKMKTRRIELATKINIIRDESERQQIRDEIDRLQRQIDTLEKFYKNKMHG